MICCVLTKNEFTALAFCLLLFLSCRETRSCRNPRRAGTNSLLEQFLTPYVSACKRYYQFHCINEKHQDLPRQRSTYVAGGFDTFNHHITPKHHIIPHPGHKKKSYIILSLCLNLFFQWCNIFFILLFFLIKVLLYDQMWRHEWPSHVFVPFLRHHVYILSTYPLCSFALFNDYLSEIHIAADRIIRTRQADIIRQATKQSWCDNIEDHLKHQKAVTNSKFNNV